MIGTISTNQKCFECGGILKYIEGAGILQCQDHPQIIWRNGCFVRFGAKHTKRFKTVGEAERHLTGLRWQTDQGKYDVRDWQVAAPLSFLFLRKKFIEFKKTQEITVKQIQHIDHVLEMAGKNWDRLNIKEILEGEIDDFFLFDHRKTTKTKLKNGKFKITDQGPVGKKTLANWKTVLHDFWKWVVRREKRRSRIEMPDFPDIVYKMGWRGIVDMDIQREILDEIKKISLDFNPRIWLGIKLLSMYPKIRPGEMTGLKEGNINLKDGWLFFPDPKEGDKGKFVHIDQEDCDLIRSVWAHKGLPTMPFFRHLQTKSGVKAGVQFGPKYFRLWWNKACKNLGIEGIDLYGGTKHSTVTALGKLLTPEQIQRGVTGHASDAFKRYMIPDINEARIGAKAVKEIQKLSDPSVIHLSERSSS